MKIAVIGMGNMGSQYAQMIAEGKIPGMELAAVTRVRKERWETLKDIMPQGLKIYESAQALYDAFDRGEVQADGVIIATPHYAHSEEAVQAFERGLHVLCDKPAGVYSRQAREMTEAYRKAAERKNAEQRKAAEEKPGLLYGFIFNQRTMPVYRKLRELVRGGKYGDLKRVNWVVTDWYRSNAYYTSNAWRGTWKGDGGGTLLNQCPHNLDLLQWICGMPARVQGFCHEGKYHPIEVEDEVTAYMEWENGATGIFIASTGEAPGVNRLELSMDNALLVCENGKIRVCELDKPEIEYRLGTGDPYGQPRGTWSTIDCENEQHPHEKVLQEFARGNMTASGKEAVYSLLLSNAIYLSSWEKQMVEITKPDTEEERRFEQKFEKYLEEKVRKQEKKRENLPENPGKNIK